MAITAGAGGAVPSSQMAERHQIFVFTASSAAATANAAVSLWKPVEDELLRHHVPGVVIETPTFLWGVTPGPQNRPKWGAVRDGDWLLGAAHKGYFCVAQVRTTCHSASLAKQLWGSTEDGRTWEFMFVLTKPRPVAVPLAAVADYLHRKYHGLTRIGVDNLERIESAFGSVDSFVDQQFRESASPVVGLTREDVLRAVAEFKVSPPPQFSDATRYVLTFEGREYPPKAIYALALRRSLGRLVSSSEISSGNNSAAFQALRSLGFTIEPRLRAI